MFNCTCLIDFIFLKRWLINKPSSVQHSSCILRFLLKKLFFEKLKLEMAAEFGCKVACPPLGLCKKLIWFGKQTEAQSYNQLQRCLRHWTLLELKITCWRCWFCGPCFLPCQMQSYSQETMRNNGEWRRGRVWLFLSHVCLNIFNMK